MARTRKDVPPAAAPSVDALDDLNLDDMFEGGDDSLFDGLDIDLDGMGDISGSLDDKKDDKRVAADIDAMKFDLLGPSEVVESTSSSKRRKTKRKTKTPPPLQEEGDETVSPSKKKRRTAKSSNRRSKSKSRQQKDEPPSPASSTSSKSKSRTKTSSTMPPPMPRGSSGGQGMVAAAGQFGGRTKQRGSYNLPASRTSPDRQKLKDSTVTPSSKAKAGTPATLSKLEDSLNQTSRDSSFCGIVPSPTLFFPFMPTLPPEPSLPKKCHRLYPCMDTINSALSSHGSSSEKPIPSSAAEDEAIFKLLFPDSDQQSSSSDPDATQMLRRAALTSAISSARKIISTTERSKVISDLHSVCALLKRQHGFAGQSIENMERWCLDHFSEQDFVAVFGPSSKFAVSNKKRKSLSEPRSLQGSQSLGQKLAGYGGSTLRVKIKCNSFKEPTKTVLVAQIPGPAPSSVASRPPGTVGSAPKVEVTKKASSKKRKALSTSSSNVSEQHLKSASLATPEVEAVVSYANLKPSKRRERISEAVTSQAVQFEQKYNEVKQNRHMALLRQEGELQKVIQNDELLMVNTATLWEWVEKSLYFADYTEDDVNEVLHHAWHPELKEKNFLDEDLPPVHLIRKEQHPQDNKRRAKQAGVSRKSLFDRLQSLLVDVGSDDEMEDSDDEPELEENDQSSIDAETPASNAEIPFGTILDVSKLSLEERTFIQLRSIGLVDSPFLSSPDPVLIEEEEETMSEDGEGSNDDDTEPDDDEGFDGVLRAMHSDLARLQRTNNSRTAMLQSAARTHLSRMQQTKKRKEDQTQQITKYNQLLKKQKENKRSARQKTPKKDEDWFHW